MKSDCGDTTLLGSFMENHDVARFPSLTSDISLAKNAIAFTILADGIPIIYEGQEQHYTGTGGGGVPYNREAIWLSGYSTTATLYTWIASLNQIRNQAIYKDGSYVTYKAYPVYSDSSTIVMRKGDTNYQVRTGSKIFPALACLRIMTSERCFGRGLQSQRGVTG
jgi:alpha-amylase